MFSLRRRKEPELSVSGVVVAAGAANRMNGIDKQQALIDEVPVVVRSVLQLSASPRIREIVLVCREGMIPDYYALVQDYGLDKVASVVAGGGERQDSVFAGIRACDNGADFYLIHDGARPLVTGEVVEGCLDAAIACGAAAAGVPVKDTLKICDPDGRIRTTPNRESLFAVQTPQAFEAGLYRRAMAEAERTGNRYTDDCQLVEQCGGRVYISAGSYENIKITTPEDLAVAQAILAYREGEMDQWGTME